MPHLYDLIEPRDPERVEAQVVDTVSSIDPDFDTGRLRRMYRDTVALFRGQYPGYRASDAWYHDLEHTSTVLICTAAMLAGAHYSGIALTSRGRLLALAGALFHDVGLIRREDEAGDGTGARYTVGHEARSIDFMARYFRVHGFSEADIEDTTHLIQCTALNSHLDEIPFRSHEIRNLGQILGSADVIGQMADRAYLEKLLLLYREFREGGIPGYGSERELLEKTPSFYRNVVQRRLEEELNHADALLEPYAREHWGLPEEPFHSAIERNLEYLNGVMQRDPEQYRRHLRRRGITEGLPSD